MTSNRIKLTRATIERDCLPPAPGEVNANGKRVLERFYWDDEVRGFGIVVREKSRSFIVQKDVKGRSVRVTIGRFPDWTSEQARKRARELVVEMDKGGNPNRREREEAARGVTLAEAIEWHKEAMRARECAERSIASVSYEIGLHLGDWLKRPLAEITPNECATRHRRIKGKYAANRVMRLLRACYNTAEKRQGDLPKCPIKGVTFNKQRRRQEPILWSQLAAWGAKVDAIGNPIRRDLQLFVLFTGLRSTDARTVRWEHVNLGTEPTVLGRVEIPPGCMHRPKPKGGEDCAFTVPLSAFVLDILRRRRAENSQLYPDDGGWVFPTRDMQGAITYVQEMKEQVVGPDGKKVGKLQSPHRLRDTFATAAREASVEKLALKVLMNHKLPKDGDGDVTDGYIRNSVEHLRVSVERVSAFLQERLWPKGHVLHAVPRAEAG
ncbi:MAG: integrase family protein [Planctomycetota bacterium]|nr:integrase family protein [Planctomycetota bacterium]